MLIGSALSPGPHRRRDAPRRVPRGRPRGNPPRRRWPRCRRRREHLSDLPLPGRSTNAEDCPTADLRGSAIERLSALASRHNHSPSHERSIRLMKDQFIHSPVGGEVELHPEALKLVDDERSALVGTEFVGWLAANCQRELSIVVLPDNSSRASVAERAGAVLTEGRIRAIAAWNAGEDALGWS